MNEDFDFSIFKNIALPPPVTFQNSIKSIHKREKPPILKRNRPNDDGFAELLEEIKANLRATQTRKEVAAKIKKIDRVLSNFTVW